MSRDTIEHVMHYQRVEELPAGLEEDLLKWVLAVADTKHKIGIQFSHWVTGTPALEGAVGSAAITQDELGHARSLYGMLRDFPDIPEGIGAENDLEARDEYFAPRILNGRWETWFDVIAVNVVLDRAIHIAIEKTVDSSYAPLAGRAVKIVQEEKFHRIFGDSWLKRLMAEKPALRETLQTSLNWAWLTADAWLGPDDDPMTAKLVEHQILSADAAAMRQQWLAETTAVLMDSGFTVPDTPSDWSDWHPQFRDRS